MSAVRRKDDAAIERILECAKEEFMEKGFSEASVRTIAERAGYTTGMLYARFADKDELFRAIVEEGADKLFDYFCSMQIEFASFPAEKQREEMHSYVAERYGTLIDIIYEYFDEFRLIVCKSAGSSYQYYIDKMVQVEADNTVRYISLMRENGMNIPEIRADMNHMLANALFYGLFEIVAHDMKKSDAEVYAWQLMDFFNAGWDRLFGIL